MIFRMRCVWGVGGRLGRVGRRRPSRGVIASIWYMTNDCRFEINCHLSFRERSRFYWANEVNSIETTPGTPFGSRDVKAYCPISMWKNKETVLILQMGGVCLDAVFSIWRRIIHIEMIKDLRWCSFFYPKKVSTDYLFDMTPDCRFEMTARNFRPEIIKNFRDEKIVFLKRRKKRTHIEIEFSYRNFRADLFHGPLDNEPPAARIWTGAGRGMASPPACRTKKSTAPPTHWSSGFRGIKPAAE